MRRAMREAGAGADPEAMKKAVREKLQELKEKSAESTPPQAPNNPAPKQP